MHIFMKLFNLGLKSPAVHCCALTKTPLKGYRKACKFTAFFTSTKVFLVQGRVVQS